MQATLKMSEATVKRLLAEEEHDLSRRETVPAISRVRPRRISEEHSAIRVRVSPDMTSTTEPVVKRAGEEMKIELQPIFDACELRVVGHEARVVKAPGSARHSLLPKSDQRLVRDRAVDAFVRAKGHMLFLDVHPSDLLDAELYAPTTALGRIASKVVLTLRGRVRDVMVEDLRARISVLRFQGFRIAVADVDSAPARLSLIAEVAPEYLKIDPSLVRGIGRSDAKRRIVQALTTMCGLLGTTAIGEGVETAAERAELVACGCHLAQGPLHAEVDLPSIKKVGGRR